MKKLGLRLLSILCSISLCLLSQPVSYATVDTSNAQSYNQSIAAYARQLEEKYGLTIHYPTRTNGYAAIGTVTLGMLDQTLEYISPEVIRELSRFFLETNNRKISIEYVYPPEGYETAFGVQLASFTSDLSRLQIYIPRYNGQMLLSGNSPTAIVHEFGHAFQEFVEAKHGAAALQSQWLQYNDDYSYRWDRLSNPSTVTFATAYASTDYYEDFAESFAQAFTANRDGLGIRDRLVQADGSRTSLGKKVGLIEALVQKYIAESKSAVETIHKIYSAAPRASYRGVSLSGNALEYIGFSEPNGVKDGVLRSLGIEAASAVWDKAIGGWYILDARGNPSLAFPGGSLVPLSASQAA